jgi:hypothetical protein
VSYLVYKFCNLFRRHLSGKDMMCLLGEELPLPLRYRRERHLARCHRCAVRYEQLRGSALAVTTYCDDLVAFELDGLRAQRQQLLIRVDSLLHHAARRPRPVQVTGERISGRNFQLYMNPTLATALVLAVASLMCIVIGMQQRRPDITSNALLVHAEVWDEGHASAAPGIISQRIEIKTPERQLYRTLYRDTQGKRRPRLQKLLVHEAQLQASLATAGVSWDAPLSASLFQDWHDRQRVREDYIKRSGKNLLVLTTTVPDGPVAEQSLTVRNSDFHPLQRTIVFRDQGVIEIAELDYHVLGWTQENAELFEPLRPQIAERILPMQPVLVARLPSLPTEEQLDEAELSARVILNQAHADTGEQIQLVRAAQRVDIRGLVETEERKQELQSQLRTLPFTTLSILSVEELNRNSASSSEATAVSMVSAEAQPSPLETLYLSLGQSVSSLSGVSQQLVDSALTVNQESRSITGLVSRFGSPARMTDLARASLSELVFSHREHLLAALEQEQVLLRKTSKTPVPLDVSGSSRPAEDAASLVMLAERNLALCKELTLGGAQPPRNAEVIIAELLRSLDELRIRAHETRLHSPENKVAASEKE